MTQKPTKARKLLHNTVKTNPVSIPPTLRENRFSFNPMLQTRHGQVITQDSNMETSKVYNTRSSVIEKISLNQVIHPLILIVT